MGFAIQNSKELLTKPSLRLLDPSWSMALEMRVLDTESAASVPGSLQRFLWTTSRRMFKAVATVATALRTV